MLDPKELERKTVGKVIYKVESATITTAQRIQLRKLFQKLDLSARQGEELACALPFLQKMLTLAEQAGGEAPKPPRPDTAFLEELRLTAGNEQLLAIYNQRENLANSIDSWTDLAGRIAGRWHTWLALKQLAAHAANLLEANMILAQVRIIENKRQLLDEPDAITPLCASLTQLLREELNRLDDAYAACHEEGMKKLASDENWQRLSPEQRYPLMSEQNLHETARPAVNVQTTADVLNTLNYCTLDMFNDKVAAMQGRFDNVQKAAAELCEPEVQFISIPRRTLKTPEEIDAWADETKQLLKAALNKGPVVIK